MFDSRREQILSVGGDKQVAPRDANLAEQRSRSARNHLHGDRVGRFVIANHLRDGRLNAGRTIQEERHSRRPVLSG